MMNLQNVTEKDIAKFAAAFHAAQMVQDGMQVGLGTGTATFWFIALLAERIRNENLKITAIAGSAETAELADVNDIPLVSLDHLASPDLMVDGADEISPELDLIKGASGAHLREKVVASAANRIIVIADASKYVTHLGKYKLPVEVGKFGWKVTMRNISELLDVSLVETTDVELRKQGLSPFVTSEGNYIIDCYCTRIEKPEFLNMQLNQIPGVIDNGLFIGMADTIILGHDDGQVRVIDREDGDTGLFDPNFPIDLEAIIDT